MRATLADIESAVRANFLINPRGKFLETGGEFMENRMKNGARMVFIGTAIGLGHKVDAILQYIHMDVREFNNLLAKYYAFRDSGQEKYFARKAEGKKTYDQSEALDADLRVYRKTVLVCNYILNLKRQRLNYI